MPRVSVLLPVRDAGTRLTACLDSLAAQTLEDHEVVAIDDGSSDDSGEQLISRAKRDRRLRVLRTAPRGLVPALQLALAEARSPLVARMDADDVAFPRRLELQVDRLERDGALDVLGCRIEAVADRGARPGAGMCAYVAWTNTLLDHEALARERFVESPIIHPSVVMRTETLRRIGGWHEFCGPEDYELWLRAFDRGWRFSKLPQVLLAWRDSPGRLTRSDPRYAPARFLSTKLEALVRGPLRGRSVVLWGAGPTGKRWARALLAAGQTVRAFLEIDPRKIGRSLYGAPVLPVSAAGGLRGSLHLAAVGRKAAVATREAGRGTAEGPSEPRERIRHEAARFGIEDGRELFAVA